MEKAIDMYEYAKQVRQCYQLLRDEFSRKIFVARFTLDLEPSPQHTARIVRLGEQQEWLDAINIPAILHTLEQNPKKLILYGTNVSGRTLASFFWNIASIFTDFAAEGPDNFQTA